MIRRLFAVAMAMAMSLQMNDSYADPERSTFNANGSTVASYIGLPLKIIDSSQNGFDYSYGPTIIYANGQHHAYFCSTGTGTWDWDHVRHSTSNDLRTWTAPSNLITSTPYERANCDPSVIRFNAGDGDYYYMVYSGNVYAVQTVNFIARSTSPNGPFAKYTSRGTWEYSPADAQPIIWPHQNSPEGSNVYGAGQPSVVVHNGVAYQWYSDTTVDGSWQIMLATSTDMIHWSTAVSTGVYGGSVDVKYYDAYGVFVMFEIVDTHTASSHLAIRTSTDGEHWSAPTTICGTNCLPAWTHNVGVSGDDQGHLIPGKVLVSYGAPYDLSPLYWDNGENNCNSSTPPYCWGYWDLYGQFLGLGGDAPASQADVPIFRFYNPSSEEHFLTSSSAEGLAVGYQLENWGWPLFSLFSTQFPGSRPLYRCRTLVGYHLASNYSDCEGQIYEGLYGYMYDYGNQVPGSIPIYRLYRSSNGDHLISLWPDEGVIYGYQYIGMLGYALP